MELLLKIRDSNYPREYLLSRVRARLPLKVFHDIHSVTQLRVKLGNEFRWLYSQMNAELRDIFSSVFIYFELKNIFAALRFRLGAERDFKDVFLASLLSIEIQNCLTEEKKLIKAINCVVKSFNDFFKVSEPLDDVFIQNGLKSFEEKLNIFFYKYALNTAKDEAVAEFFRYKIDERNIMAVYKHIRWDIEEYPELISGGKVNRERLLKAFQKYSYGLLEDVIKSITGVEADIQNIENVLKTGMTRLLTRLSKNTLSNAVILHYLWVLYMDALARNIYLSNLNRL